MIFGLAKNTTGTDIQWQIHFTLFERTKRTDLFGDPIVKLDVDVHTSLAANAEALAHSKPTPGFKRQVVRGFRWPSDSSAATYSNPFWKGTTGTFAPTPFYGVYRPNNST